ncbi:MAG: hypothetical protein ACK523_08835, partial [Pirellulaceae bacterium]
ASEALAEPFFYRRRQAPHRFFREGKAYATSRTHASESARSTEGKMAGPVGFQADWIVLCLFPHQ